MGYGPGEVSEAARLRHMLRTSGHGITTWGWVMYRCTYQSDAQWQAFMKIINDRVRNHLKFDEDQELMNTLDWHVQEDQRYASATKDQIRRYGAVIWLYVFDMIRLKIEQAFSQHPGRHLAGGQRSQMEILHSRGSAVSRIGSERRGVYTRCVKRLWLRVSN